MDEQETGKIDRKLHRTFTLMNMVIAIGRDLEKRSMDFQTAQRYIQRRLLERNLQGDIELSLNGKSLLCTFAMPDYGDRVTLEVEDYYGRDVQVTVKYGFRYPVIFCDNVKK